MSLRAGQVAAAAGVNRETLRYYERRGLLEMPDRSPGGHRLYDDRTVATLRVIKAAQRLGSTLDEVADLIEVGRRRGRDSGLQVRAQHKLAEVEQRIADRPPSAPTCGLRSTPAVTTSTSVSAATAAPSRSSISPSSHGARVNAPRP
jgi:DNA-binding transcriptional MerR regulator